MAIDKDMYLAYDKWKRENPREVGSDSWFAFRAGWLACKAAQQSAHLTKATPRWWEVLVNKISGLFTRFRR